MRVNPQNDHRVIVSDFHNPTQGEMCSSEDVSQVYCFIVGLTLQHARKIFVATNVFTAVPGQVTSKILRVNAVTGERILVTDFDNSAQGADTGELLQGGNLAVEASGHLLASLAGSSERRWNLLFRIDPRTGNRTVLSNFDNRAQGTRGMYPFVAVEASGQILAFALPYFDDGQTQVNEKGALFRVDPTTRKRTVVSNFNNAAQAQKSTAPVVYIAVVPTALRPRGVAERADECPAAETGPPVAIDGCN